MVMLLNTHTTSEHADSLADYMPGGPLWANKKCLNTNLRGLLEGLAESLRLMEEDINLVTDEYNIPTTTLFIESWEGFVGIPDDCFIIADTIEQRRRNVLTKLTALGVQTAQDFVDVAAIFGITVTVTSGACSGSFNFTYTFPIGFSNSAKDARFTIVVDFIVDTPNRFPLIFPIPFGDELISILECLFNILRPANCIVLFRQV